MGDFISDIQADELDYQLALLLILIHKLLGVDLATAADWNEYQEWYDGQEACYPEPEDDGQPSEYEEWQDVHGGDDWDHGQYDGMDYDFGYDG
jgi:hypothetical protein